MFLKIKQLTSHLAVYGIGDIVTSAVSFLLLPVYVRYLSPTDYGVLGVLVSVEALAKIVFRWGVDASFMRLYFDCDDEARRRSLASTLFIFLVAVNGVLIGLALVLAPPLAANLFGAPGYETLLRLMLVTTFIMGSHFIPFHVLRILGKSRQFIALSFSRSVTALLLRVILVIGIDMGVLGVVVADAVTAVIFSVVLLPLFVPLIRPTFSLGLLRESLAFGLPRLPHGIAHQVIAVADRYLLSLFATLREVGLYSIGASIGLGPKLFLSAFEVAWAPFYFRLMNEPDARAVYSRVTTYGLAVLILLTAGLSAVADDLVHLVTTPEFYPAATVIPWIAVGVTLQGTYLLTSIGLNITKRTIYYPIATGLGAVTSLGSNLLLIPRYGALGAAWSNVLAYAVLAGAALCFSQRFYPIRLEWARMAQLAGAGAVAYALARVLVPQSAAPWLGFLLRGSIVAAGYPALLLLVGFLNGPELARLRETAAALRRRAAPSR